MSVYSLLKNNLLASKMHVDCKNLTVINNMFFEKNLF